MMIKRASAAIAVSAFGLALGAGASFADDHGDEIPCGAPAVPAVYDWVVTQRPVAEQSHLEYEWARQTAPARTEWRWQRVTTTTIYTWALWVPKIEEEWSATSPGDGWVKTDQFTVKVLQPAVTVTKYEFQKWNQQREEFFGPVRWELDPAWNAKDSNDKAEGWERTPTPPTDFVTTPAVTETQYLWQRDAGSFEYQDSATSPGDGWQEQGVKSSDTVTEDVWSESEPEGEGWVKTEESRTVAATFEYRWAAESPGDGWVKTDAEPKKVVDVPAVPEVREWAVVVPAIPAGEPCPVDEDPDDEDPVEEPVDEEPVDEPADPQEAPAVPVTPTAATPRPASAVPQPTAVQTTSPTSLAHTGTELTLLWTGLGLVVVGAGLGAGYRRVARES
jgi:hypothetical protein